jgi:hypothetical protein
MNIITQKQVQLTSQSAESQPTATELVLKVGNPLLIVLTPYSPKNAWWRDRKGVLSFHHDRNIDWNSDHTTDNNFDRSILNQIWRDGWEVNAALAGETNRTWYHLDLQVKHDTLSGFRETADGIIFDVSPCIFGGGK